MIFRPMVYRPTSGRVLTIVVFVVCVLGLVATALQTDLGFFLRSIAPFAFLGTLIFSAFWMPKIELREAEIEVRNVFSTAIIPWSAIRSIQTRWSLVFLTDRGKVNAWASPPATPSVGVGFLIRGMAIPRNTAAGEDPAPGKESVTQIIRANWDRLSDQNLHDPVGAGTGPRRSVHWATIAILAALLVAAVISVVI